MAPLAVGRLRRDVVIGVLVRDVGVAACAGIGLVDRGGKLGHIHEQGEFFAGGVGLGQRLIGVAIQAGAVLDLTKGWRDESKKYEGQRGGCFVQCHRP